VYFKTLARTRIYVFECKKAAYWQNRRFSHWALFMSFFFIGGIVAPEWRKMIGAGH